MPDYYSTKLSAERLRRCYELAPPRVRRYLEAEIDHVLDRTEPSARALELGCGYGRVLERLASSARTVVGIDTSADSLRLACTVLRAATSCHLIQMNASRLALRDAWFDIVVCIQNGLSAFSVDPRDVVREAVRVTRPGGTVLFSSYSDRFWEARLEWFEIQSEHGLVGEIDYEASGNGVIVCKDGFRAVTVRPDDFMRLASELDVSASVTEVDGSSIFCEIHVE